MLIVSDKENREKLGILLNQRVQIAFIFSQMLVFGAIAGYLQVSAFIVCTCTS